MLSVLNSLPPQESIAKNDLAVDCISRAYLLDDSKYHTVFNDDTGNFEDVVYREDIEKAPSVTPIRPKGHWIDIDEAHSKCSRCGAVFEIYSENGEANYCPNCGSDIERIHMSI